METGLARVTLTLEREDVDLLDRLAQLEDSNRSAELRSILAEVRPMLRATVDAFERASAQREQLTKAAAQARVDELEAMLPEVEKLSQAFLGAISRIEGAQAARDHGSGSGETPVQ